MSGDSNSLCSIANYLSSGLNVVFDRSVYNSKRTGDTVISVAGLVGRDKSQVERSEQLRELQRAGTCDSGSSNLSPNLTTSNLIFKGLRLVLQVHNAYKDRGSLGRSVFPPVWVQSRSNHLGQYELYYVRRQVSTMRLQVF